MAKQKSQPPPQSHRPTLPESRAELQALKALKPKLRSTSSFGESHQEAVDAQIWVLETLASTNEIYTRYPGEAEGEPQNLLDAALDARRYLDGELGLPTLVETWKELVQDS